MNADPEPAQRRIRILNPVKPPMIRRATDADVEPVVAIFADWHRHERDQMRLSRFDDWHVHLVAEFERRVVGYASVTPEGWGQDQYPETRAMGTNWGFLADLVVAREHRSQGIGAELVRCAAQAALESGAQGLAVNPDATGERQRLFKFYEACEFLPVRPQSDPDWPYYFLRF